MSTSKGKSDALPTSWAGRTQLVAKALALLAATGFSGLFAYGMIFNEGSIAIGLLATPFVFGATFLGILMLVNVVLFPVVGTGVALFRAGRRGARQVQAASRAAALASGPQVGQEALARNGWPTALPAPVLADTDWARPATRLRFLTLSQWGLGLGISAAGVALGLCVGWVWTFSIVAIVLGILAADAISPDGLGPHVMGLIADALKVERKTPKKAVGTRHSVAQLPGGGTLRLSTPRHNAHSIKLSIVWPYAFEVFRITHDRLEEEAVDQDCGEPTFDNATLVIPGKDRTALITSRLDAETRPLLMWLLHLGGEVKKGFAQLNVSLADKNALVRIQDAILCLNALHDHTSGSVSETVRAHGWLQRGSDAERAALIDELGRITDPELVASIASEWASGGTGSTRVDAALCLDARRSERYLAQISQDPKAADAVRGRALAKWGESQQTAAAKCFVRALEAGDTAHVDGLANSALSAAFKAQLRRQSAKAKVNGAPAVLLGWLLVTRAEAPLDSVIEWLERPVQNPSRATVDALTEASEWASKGPFSARLKAALTRVTAQFEGRRGALMVAAPGAEGQLALK